jgi:hypothetical protein
LARKLPKYLAPVTLDAPRTARSPHPATGGSQKVLIRAEALSDETPNAAKRSERNFKAVT